MAGATRFGYGANVMLTVMVPMLCTHHRTSEPAGATRFGYGTNVTQTVQRAARPALRGLVMVLTL